MNPFDHTRIRYIYLRKYVCTVRLYTRRYRRFSKQYRCYEAVASHTYKSGWSVKTTEFCTKHKTGDYLCAEPIFPEYEGKTRSSLEHNELYRSMLLLLCEIDILKETVAEHRQKMIEKQLPAAFSHYEEALFQG